MQDGLRNNVTDGPIRVGIQTAAKHVIITSGPIGATQLNTIYVGAVDSDFRSIADRYRNNIAETSARDPANGNDQTIDCSAIVSKCNRPAQKLHASDDRLEGLSRRIIAHHQYCLTSASSRLVGTN